MKYNSSNIYHGDIVRIENNQKKIIKKDAELCYFENEDAFGDFGEVFGYIYSLYLEPEKLTEEQKEQYQEIIKENTYQYGETANEGETFILESSIKVFIDSSKNKYKR